MSERTQVTILLVSIGPQESWSMAAIAGEGTRYYYLPGADYPATVAALRDAGFETGDRFWEVVHRAGRSKQDD